MRVRKAILLMLTFLFNIPVLGQVDTAWVRRYNGLGNEDDLATALAVDKSRNVFVTGYSAASLSNFNATTIKYSPNGDISWISNYDGPGGFAESTDVANSIAVDDSGNVYLTGYSYRVIHYDFTTIKYEPNGDTLWVRSYNGSANAGDVAYDIAVDDSCNVYITGLCEGATSYSDYATIKYAPNGDTLWVRQYNGPDNNVDAATDLIIDSSGNLFVTGHSYNNGASSDYVTIKYAPNGDTIWVRRYHRLGSDYNNATALALDDSGNVYVTGASDGDYGTIKYSSQGDTIWIRHFNGPGNGGDLGLALKVDRNGYVYLTGSSVGEGSYYDYATMKYTPNGDTLWVRRYDGPGFSLDQPEALALDDSGNVYITGSSGTIKYSSNGDLIWFGVYGGSGLALDDSNNVYVTGPDFSVDSRFDYLTVKYVQFECNAKSGDANGDGNVNLTDIVFVVNHLFKGGSSPFPVCSGDDNVDGKINLGDIIYKVNYIFKGGPVPVKNRECCL